MNKIQILILFALLVFSCKKHDNNDCYKKESKYISFDFETSLENWQTLGGRGERAIESDIKISTDTFYSGTKSAKFTVSPNSLVNSGARAELTFDPNIEEGDVIFWEYSIYIPANYQDVNLYDNSNKVNWQVMGQWHDQPDECIGQTWNILPSQSPPIGIYYNYLNNSDPSYESIMNEGLQNNIFGFDSSWNHTSVLSLVYNNETIAIKEISKGQWIHLKFHTKWSTGDDGFIQGWINETPFTNGQVYGRNMWNRASHYFKFGLYRNPTIPYTNFIYYDDIEIY